MALLGFFLRLLRSLLDSPENLHSVGQVLLSRLNLLNFTLSACGARVTTPGCRFTQTVTPDESEAHLLFLDASLGLLDKLLLQEKAFLRDG